MVSRRTKEKIRDISKVLKTSWKMFSESITGLVGLGIIFFFVIIAVLAPVLGLKDPMHWTAPYSDILVGVESNATSGSFTGTLASGPASVPPVGEKIYKAYILTTEGTKGKISGISLRDNSVVWTREFDGTPVQNFTYFYLVAGAMSAPTNITIFVCANTASGGKLYIFVDDYQYNIASKDIKMVEFPSAGYFDKIGGVTFPAKIIRTGEYWPFFVVSEKGKVYGLQIRITQPGTLLKDLQITVQRGFADGSEYQIPGNATVYGDPLQLHGQRVLVVTHEQGITFIQYNSTGYPWTVNPFGNYSFKPSQRSSPVTSKYYKDLGSFNPETPIFAGSDDGLLYLFRLNSQAISNPVKYGVGSSSEKIVGISASYEEECQVYTASENGKVMAFTYNRTEKVLRENYELDLGGNVIASPYFSKATDKVFVVTEKSGIRIMWVLNNVITESGVIRYTYETRKDISPPFPTGQVIQFNVTAYNPNTGAFENKTETGEVVLLCDRNTNGILLIAEKIRTPLPPGTYPSGNTYWLGTDTQGRDILSRIVWGSQIALFIGVTAAVLSMLLGTIIGLVSGYYGGSIDLVLMRITDVFLVIPFLPLVIILAAVLGSSVMNIIYVLVLIGWPGIARVIRSMILSLKERPFIDAARVTGASNFRIMFKHLFPNVVPLAVLYMTFTVSGAILTEAALSFIGLGDPNSVSWGIILHDAQYSNAVGNWWMTIPAGLCITMISMGFYLVGRAVEQIINPRLRSR
ncbi:MAG: ABC transporter permease [Thermoplasmata archaeon]|nr:ABC transporter permease [Thermoplasmata archaeon]